MRARVQRRLAPNTLPEPKLLEQRRNGQLTSVRTGPAPVAKLHRELPGL